MQRFLSFGLLPADGAGGGMKDWVWKSDLIRIPQCLLDVTMEVKFEYSSNVPIMANMMNYNIDQKVSDYEFTGYQVIVNGGGGSLTLSRFINADSRALAFVDRWPGTTIGNETGDNPVDGGPYRGWNFRNGNWPAGGAAHHSNQEQTVAVRYRYVEEQQQYNYILRGKKCGCRSKPRGMGRSGFLTGEDSLTPGGSFGIAPILYHSTSAINNAGIDIVSSLGLRCKSVGFSNVLFNSRSSLHLSLITKILKFVIS